MVFFNDEELVSLDVEVSRIQQSLQWDQPYDLGADHRQLQLLNATNISQREPDEGPDLFSEDRTSASLQISSYTVWSGVCSKSRMLVDT